VTLFHRPTTPSLDGSGWGKTLEGDEVDVATLLVRERRAHVEPSAGQSRVWARLQASLNFGPRGPGGGGTAAPVASSAQESARIINGWARTLPIAVGTLAASMLIWSAHSICSRIEDVPVRPAAAPLSPKLAAVVELKRDEGIPVSSVYSLPSAKSESSILPKALAESSTTSPRDDCTLCEERALLEAGRLGLRDGRYELALASIKEHEARFASGQLAEEREGLRVRVLAAMGSTKEAERRRDDFLRRFPHSPLFESVRRAPIR
jgi:hypothetical protein